MSWIEDYCKKTEQKDRVGRCYELAYKGLCPEWFILCHGFIHWNSDGEVGCIHHAWLSNGDEVFDPVMGLRLPFDAYARMFRPDEVVMWGQRMADRFAHSSGHYGPWHETDDDRIRLLPKSKVATKKPLRGKKTQ